MENQRKIVKTLLGLMAILFLSACSVVNSYHISRYCNYDGAVAAGINDARNKFDLAVNFAKNCPGDQDMINAAYRKGYLYGLATKSKM